MQKAETFTTEQRHRIYFQAAAFIENETYMGMCNALYASGSRIRPIENPTAEAFMDYFPEVKNQDPGTRHAASKFWFFPTQIAPRVRILNQAIEATK